MRGRAVTPDEKVPTEARLWQAVIVSTIREWLSGPLRLKRQAEDYLFHDNKDFPVVQGVVLMFVIMVIVINLVVDILNALLDPRVAQQ